MEQAQIERAWRRRLRYDLDEALPDHRSLTKFRGRYGLAVFRQFFEQIVRLCEDTGLVWGRSCILTGRAGRPTPSCSVVFRTSNMNCGTI